MTLSPADPAESSFVGNGTTPSADHVAILVRQLQEATAQLESHRRALTGEAAPQIRHTEDRLRDVTEATETAATSILDGVTQLTELVDSLGKMALPSEAAPIVGQLSDGLFDLMGHLQFQDITSQQLRYAESVLRATECQLITMASEGSGIEAPERTDAAPEAFDPRASTKPAPNRQASIDALFA
jgi:chemotaxis regulatin CheY-phosphate phosphatase CheZ